MKTCNNVCERHGRQKKKTKKKRIPLSWLSRVTSSTWREYMRINEAQQIPPFCVSWWRSAGGLWAFSTPPHNQSATWLLKNARLIGWRVTQACTQVCDFCFDGVCQSPACILHACTALTDHHRTPEGTQPDSLTGFAPRLVWSSSEFNVRG